MRKWILKAVVQKVISWFPFKHKLNFFFQKHVTKGVYLTEGYFGDRLGHARDHLKNFHRVHERSNSATFLELGTGWYPVVPVTMYLAGFEAIYTVDISSFLDKEKILTTIQKFIDWYEHGWLSDYLPVNGQRMDALKKILAEARQKDVHWLTRELKITYVVGDARKLPLPSGSVDLVTSNNTFEHIYPGILKDILGELNRVLKKGGVMSHFIDMSDHFAHFDKSITIYNFLKFSDGQWKLIDNSIQPQNRLRIDHYLSMYKSLNIPVTVADFRPGELDALRSVRPASAFRNMSIDRLAISHCLLRTEK